MDKTILLTKLHDKISVLRQHHDGELSFTITANGRKEWQSIVEHLVAAGMAQEDIMELGGLVFHLGCKQLSEETQSTQKFMEAMTAAKDDQVIADLEMDFSPDGTLPCSITIECDEKTKSTFDTIVGFAEQAGLEGVALKLTKATILRAGIMEFAKDFKKFQEITK